MEYFDSHAHYNDERFDNEYKDLIKENFERGITKTTCVGYNLESSKKAIEIANQFEYIYATCGISPNDITENVWEDLKELRKLVENKKIVAIGEIGLDYYWNKDNKELQKQVFIEQIKLANEFNLPIVIHTRDAAIDTIEILKNIQPCTNKGIFHCCPLNQELIKEGLKLDYYISFSGVITFKNSKPDECIKLVPNEKILIETDSPYLTPEPNRGKRNDPSNVIFVARKIAEIKGCEESEIALCSMENACKIFGVKFGDIL